MVILRQKRRRRVSMWHFAYLYLVGQLLYKEKHMFTLSCRKNNSIFMLCCKVLNSNMTSHWCSSNYLPVVYFQAPYCNFCHFNKTCPHFIMYFTYITSNIYWIYIYIYWIKCAVDGNMFCNNAFLFYENLKSTLY